MSSLPFAQTRRQYARKIVNIFLITVAAVFNIGSVLDFVLLNVVVMSTCKVKSRLWRPMNEMMSKMWVMHLTLLVQSTLFAYLYTRFFAEKQEHLQMLVDRIGKLDRIRENQDKGCTRPMTARS